MLLTLLRFLKCSSTMGFMSGSSIISFIISGLAKSWGISSLRNFKTSGSCNSAEKFESAARVSENLVQCCTTRGFMSGFIISCSISRLPISLDIGQDMSSPAAAAQCAEVYVLRVGVEYRDLLTANLAKMTSAQSLANAAVSVFQIATRSDSNTGLQ